MQQRPPWSFRSAASPGSVGYKAGSERWSGLLVNIAFRTGHISLECLLDSVDTKKPLTGVNGF